jgi:glycosyltransferase involved in cell wall biosynthesis
MINHTNIFSKAGLQNAIHHDSDEMLNSITLNKLSEVVFITSYPPRECGLATYSQDLIKALNNKFDKSFTISICALESESEKHTYSKGCFEMEQEVKFIFNVDQPETFIPLAKTINSDSSIRIILVQHEFGLFKNCENEFKQFLKVLTKPVIIVFHTVLPGPNSLLKQNVQELSKISESIIVMTHFSEKVLTNEYDIPQEKISIIPHGTHLVPHLDVVTLKDKYEVSGKKVLTTFGLLSSGKSIETTLSALPAIIEKNPEVLFLIIGKTHPSVAKQEGEKYRQLLEAKVAELKLQPYVRFINHFLPLPDLLEYLQLTDVYLFTSKDPNQAVSGTFAYASSCGCPIVSTPIPHAREVLGNDAGIIFDFGNHEQLAKAVNSLLADEPLRKNISSHALHRMASTAWENAAIAHALLFETIGMDSISLRYTLPSINLDHVKKMTTDFGIIQFSKINQPDITSGYTLDDNARALIAICQHFELTGEEGDIKLIVTYLNFIKYCQKAEGSFINYVDENEIATNENDTTNLDDSNGRAIWALGYLISIGDLLPADFKSLVITAEAIIKKALVNINAIHSTRAMAFAIKGLYYQNFAVKGSYYQNTNDFSLENLSSLKSLADRLVQMYRHEAKMDWRWYESYLTYANSTLPEALLCAWLATGEPLYKEIAKTSFDFLLLKTFKENRIKVISNKNWMHNGEQSIQALSGEQPIDVAYTILALNKFYDVFNEPEYLSKMKISFEWFLGNNHLHQIIYNPCTGGCYDGLEENYVNLNQGAESTVSYLMARLTIAPQKENERNANHSKTPLLEVV